ncbi:MAG TPA: hypothetical protein VHW43_13815 [Puia sp.]|nr:hypothetical protein [Puia sp.]
MVRLPLKKILSFDNIFGADWLVTMTTGMSMAAIQNQAAPKVGQYEKYNRSAPNVVPREKCSALVRNKLKFQVRLDHISPGIQPNGSEIQPAAFYKTFTITFHYLKRFHRLKVMKVSRAYAVPIYKIVLGSALKSNSWICWLQHQSKSWSLILGNDMDEKLLATIGLAIEDHQ